jgi:CDGSH-type Zn-finger protein
MRIKVTHNGPYLVTGGVPLIKLAMVLNAQGEPVEWRLVHEYPLQETYSLCRCGSPTSMPFCDGSHRRNGFVGAETASHRPYLEQAERTVGPTLDLTDADVLCAGAGFCHRAGGTWGLTERSDNPRARQIAIEEAGNCPAGRLVAWTKSGVAIEPDLGPSIAVTEEPDTGAIGPYWVRGGITIEAADGTTYEVRNRVTLCRCGKSGNKPFCDASHQF